MTFQLLLSIMQAIHFQNYALVLKHFALFITFFRKIMRRNKKRSEKLYAFHV